MSHNPRKLPVSVCMIVRDEERNLAEALRSVCDLVSEIVIVDTGSHDRTMAIAREFDVKLLTFPWQDDFSLARNVALQAATSDWILSLDADQRLAPHSQQALALALTHSHKAQTVTIQAITDDSAGEQLGAYTALRLFRRDAKIRYQGRIHESIAESLLAIGSNDWPDSNVTLLDIGYSSAVDRQRKKDRNLQLLERSRAENPNDLYVAYKLALTFPDSRNDERSALLFETIKMAQALPSHELRSWPFMPRLLAAAVAAYVELGRLYDAAEIALSFLHHLGGSTYFTAGRAIARTGEIAQAYELLTHFLTIDMQSLDQVLQSDPEANRAETCRWLGWLSQEAGNLDVAEHWFFQALETATLEQQAAIECERIRISIAQGHLSVASKNIERLSSLAANSSFAFKELMLVSAELSYAIGDHDGARELAQAALSATDDRAAALLAMFTLNHAQENRELLRTLFPAVIGRRYDLLAIRSKLATALEIDLDIKVPSVVDNRFNMNKNKLIFSSK